MKSKFDRRPKKLKWTDKFPLFGKWWKQEAISYTENSGFVITKGARNDRPFSLWVKSYELNKTQRFIGNFKIFTSAQKVAQLIYEG